MPIVLCYLFLPGRRRRRRRRRAFICIRDSSLDIDHAHTLYFHFVEHQRQAPSASVRASGRLRKIQSWKSPNQTAAKSMNLSNSNPCWPPSKPATMARPNQEPAALARAFPEVTTQALQPIRKVPICSLLRLSPPGASPNWTRTQEK